MFQTYQKKLEEATALNQKANTLYAVIGRHSSKMSQEVINEIRSEAETFQKKAEQIALKVAQNIEDIVQ